MKKLIYSIIAILVLSAAVCSAESYAPPEDNIGLWLKPESIAVDGGKRLDTWNDAACGNDMSQATTTRKPTVIAPGNNILNDSKTVNFGINQYLESGDINYSGDSSFVIYYKQNDAVAGHALFSSSGYVGEAITESGKIPFSIINSENNTLEFAMYDEEGNLKEHNMNIPSDYSEGYRALYVTISAAEKKVKVYCAESGEEKDFSAPSAQFEIESAPYYHKYALGMRYDTSSRMNGMKMEAAELMIYNRVLTEKEIDNINKYFRSKYERPILKKIELKSEIYEIAKGERITPELTAVYEILGNVTREDITDFTLTSSDKSVVAIVGKTSLRADNFGAALITAEYGDKSISFNVTVPQITVETETNGFGNGGAVTVKRTVKNFVPEQTLNYIMAAVLYKGSILADAKFSQTGDFNDEYIFEAEFNVPEQSDEYKIYLMVLDSEMTPVLRRMVIE